MPDLVQQANLLKTLPDQAIQSELARPTGAVPSYLVLAEAQRRATLRSGAAQRQQQTGSVYDDALRSLTASAPPAGPPGPPGMTPAPAALGSLGSMPPPGNFRPPMRMADGGSVQDDYDPYIADSAQRWGVPADFVRRVIKAESNFRRDAVSPKGATGLMQLMPDTARSLGVTDALDPQQNIDAGTQYLRKNYDRFGDWRTAAAAYNAGPAAVERHGGVPQYRETLNYLKRVQPPASDAPAPDPSTLTASAAPPPAATSPDDTTVDPDQPPIPSDQAAPPPLPSVLGAIPPVSAQAPTPPPAPMPAPAPLPTAIPLTDAQRAAQIRALYGDVDQTALRQQVADLQAQADKLGKKDWRHMLADFGWGMASSTAPLGIFGQIGQGGKAMTQAQNEREDQARQMQLKLLGVNVNLDDRVQAHQEAIAKATETASEQMLRAQGQGFQDLLKAPGAVYGSANDARPGSHFIPNPNDPGRGVWQMGPQKVTPGLIPFLGEKDDGTKYQPGDIVTPEKYISASDAALKAAAKPAGSVSKDNQLFQGAAQSVGQRYGLGAKTGYLDLPEIYTLPSAITLTEQVRRPDGTTIPAGTVLPAGATVYPRQEAEVLANRSAVDKSGETAVTKLFDTVAGRQQLVATQFPDMPTDAQKYFVQTGKFLSSPAMMQTAADMVSDYQIPYGQAVSRLPPTDRTILDGLIKQRNPQFNAGYFATANKAEGAFTSGRQADKMQSINAAIGHMGVLNDAVTSLNNGDVTMLNRIANQIHAAVGPTPAVTFKSIVQAVGPELAKAYVSGAGSEKERSAIEGAFSPDLPPEQLHANIGARAKLLGSVINSMVNEYKTGTYGRGRSHATFFTPETVGTLNRISPGAINTVSRDQVQRYADQYTGGDFAAAQKVFNDKNRFLLP